MLPFGTIIQVLSEEQLFQSEARVAVLLFKGKYELQQVLGAGGYGQIFKAFDSVGAGKEHIVFNYPCFSLGHNNAVPA